MDLSGYLLEKLREDTDFVLYRARRADTRSQLLVRAPASKTPDPAKLAFLDREYALSEELDPAWAIRPSALGRHEGRAVLLLNDPGGYPLEGVLGKPLDTLQFLSIAVALAGALRQVHGRGLIHKDIRPANFFIDDTHTVRLTGFGFATRLPREHQTPAPPEGFTGSFAYMAPEQTGRVNRSIDSRCDLYSLGITFYEMLVGSLPFSATDPTELIHCHIARPAPPPSLRVEDVPPVVEAVILKLIAKNAEDRYQSAAGVEYDLRRCLTEWRSTGRIQPFELATADLSKQLRISDRLYGREAEIGFLTRTFQKVAAEGDFSLVLVSGYSGVGKSSIVNELHRYLQTTHGLFAAGKFDQYRRNTPYATLKEAFHQLLQHILSKPDVELSQWRNALLSAVGSNGRLMIDQFPELELILGPQPMPPCVSSQEERNRFQLVFRRFVGVFAQVTHPLVLFLDDLQWLDAATFELLQPLTTNEAIPYLFLVGAYRTNEQDSSKYLRQMLDTMRESRLGLHELRLGPLPPADVRQLVADALQTDLATVQALANIVFQNTQGNPFFTAQFLTALNVEGLLEYDSVAREWQWDIDRIQAKGITDNVADLMAKKLSRYELSALEAIRQLACLGNISDVALLSRVLGITEHEAHLALRDFVESGLVHRLGRGYSFAHDRVRDAAYALVPAPQRCAIHLRIGRLQLGSIGSDDLEANIFEIVNQMNHGISLIDSPGERMRLAELNLLAGKRAKAATDYQSALNYLAIGRTLLDADPWEKAYRTTFELECEQADCRFMIGETAAAEAQLVGLAGRSASLVDLAQIVKRQAMIYTYLGRMEHAIRISLACLVRMGVHFPVDPAPGVVDAEYSTFCQHLAGRPIAALFALPPMEDPHSLLVMDVLEGLLSAAGTVMPSLQHLVILRMANISLEHGIADETCHGFACLAGLVIGWRYGKYAEAREFSDLAMRLIEQRGFDRYAARAFAVISGTVGPWSIPLRECYNLAVRSTELGRQQGGVTYWGYALACGLVALLDSGKALSDVQRHAESVLEIAQTVKTPLVIDFIKAVLFMIRALRGQTIGLHTVTDGSTVESEYEAYLHSSAHLWHAKVRYQIRKLQLQFIADKVEECLALIADLEGDVGILKVFELAEFKFYSALARSRSVGGVSPAVSAETLQAIRRCGDDLSLWATLCPDNFADRACLVAAEIARLEGRELDAERLYEQAIRLAREFGAVHNEAIANEMASRFYANRGFDVIGEAYLRHARSCYVRWEAEGKVRELDRYNPQLIDSVAMRGSQAVYSSGTQFQYLDLPAVVEMYRAVSGEIVLDRLIERLMRAVVENAGAVRGVLLLPRNAAMHLMAEAITDSETVTVQLRHQFDVAAQLPQTMLNIVTRTQEAIIVDDARMPNAFSADTYIMKVRPRSVLCLPLVNQKRLVGVLYLENTLASHAFTQDRLAMLQLLASQAAVSVENAELFQNVQTTQERARQVGQELRRSFDMIPALAWRAAPDGTFEFANKQWHDYTGIALAEARAATWIQAFHPDDEESVREKWRSLIAFRTSGEFEARMQRFDGEFRQFLVRVTPMNGDDGRIVMWHGTNTDIENLKRAEQAQEAFARISRVTALGELTVSIAHEVNQPLMAIVTNAATCLRWLTEGNINLQEARGAAERIIRDGHRAGDVIASIRALAKKAVPKTVELNLNDAIREVLVLARNELERAGIVTETQLAKEGESVLGDRVQMQQVVLNLVMNGIEAITASERDLRVLTVRTCLAEPGYVRVTVADSGVGLNAVDGERIFEMFFTTKRDGVGIGLSICRSIVEAHRGRLWASPNNPQGTELHFTVPTFGVEQLH